MKRKEFVTLFPNCPNFGLVKDVGQIPYSLSKYCGMETLLVSSQLDINGEYIKTFGLEHIKTIKLLFNSEVLTGCLFLLKYGKKIEWLNLYHCRKTSLIWSNLYKILNPTGKVYVKLDAGFTTLEKIKADLNYRKLFLKLCKKADLMTAESRVIAESLSKIANKKIEIIPNGFVLDDGVKKDEIFQKQNVFLTVGRIGAVEKNNELLLEAFAKIADKCEWNLWLVGKVEDRFKSYAAAFFERHPKLRDRVVFFGEVTNRYELAQVYNSSKVFVLPSKFESFSIATAEALASGCYLILSSEVTPKEEFTNGGKYGLVVTVNEVNELAEAMLKSSQDNMEQQKIDEMQKYAIDNFLWSNICKKLYKMLQR